MAYVGNLPAGGGKWEPIPGYGPVETGNALAQSLGYEDAGAARDFQRRVMEAYLAMVEGTGQWSKENYLQNYQVPLKGSGGANELANWAMYGYDNTRATPSNREEWYSSLMGHNAARAGVAPGPGAMGQQTALQMFPQELGAREWAYGALSPYMLQRAQLSAGALGNMFGTMFPAVWDQATPDYVWRPRAATQYATAGGAGGGGGGGLPQATTKVVDEVKKPIEYTVGPYALEQARQRAAAVSGGLQPGVGAGIG